MCHFLFITKHGIQDSESHDLTRTTLCHPTDPGQVASVPYQVGSLSEDVGDPQVVMGLMAGAGLDKHADLGGRGIVLQGGDHQAAGELGHLDKTQEEEEFISSSWSRYPGGTAGCIQTEAPGLQGPGLEGGWFCWPKESHLWGTDNSLT